MISGKTVRFSRSRCDGPTAGPSLAQTNMNRASFLPNLPVQDSGRRLFQLADFYIPVPTVVAVICQHDVPGDFVAETRLVLEFALREAGFYRVTAKLVREHLFAVEPVLDRVS